jgi:hypothetical protein
MRYSARQVDAVEAEGDLIRLWTENLDASARASSKYRWFYRSNPVGAAVAFLLRAQDEEGGDHVVGCAGLGRRILYQGDQPLDAGLVADFAIDQAHRTALPALTLQRALCAYAVSRHPAFYAFPNDAAVGVFSRIGHRVLGQMSRYVLVLRHGPFIQRRIRSAFLAGAAGRVADTAARLLAQARRRPTEGLSLSWLQDVDDRFDALWEETRHRFGVIGYRGADFLRWRFLEREGVESRLAALTEPATGRLRAYAAVSLKEEGVALVADFLAASDAHLAVLMAGLRPELWRMGFHSAVAHFMGPPSVAAVLTDHGFRFRNLAKFVVLGVGTECPGDPGRLADPASWYLTEADRDN